MRATPIKDRFWSKVDKTPGHGPKGDCWVWTATKNDRGYGIIRLGRSYVKAHRVSFELANGAIPERPGYHGTCICHECDNPACVNPAHLFDGSCGDNMRDRTAKGRTSKGLKHSLVTRGENGPNHILTEVQVLAIRNDPRLHREIAADYGIGNSTVGNIKTGRSWKHLLPPKNPYKEGIFA